MRAGVAIALAALAPVAAGCGGEERSRGTPAPVRVALDFTPNAVHAPIYAARRRGFDRAAGVALRIRPPAAAPDSLKLLGAGRVDVAVLDIHDLGLARQRGQDVVGFGALVQRPLAAVIARAGVRRPRQLEGRRVGVSGLPSDPAVLGAVMAADGGDPSRARTVTIGFSAVPSLIAGKVDAAPMFWNAEGVVLRRRGVRTREFRVDDYGAPAYPEVVLVTTRRTVERRPGLLDGVVKALSRGTEDALRDRDAAVRDIVRAGGAEPGLVRAQLDAVAPAMRPPLRLRRAALEAWASWDVRVGILERRPDVSRAFRLPAG